MKLSWPSSGSAFCVVWLRKMPASGWGSLWESSSFVLWFSTFLFRNVPGTVPECVRICGFKNTSSNLDRAPKMRDSVLLNSWDSFLVTLLSISSEIIIPVAPHRLHSLRSFDRFVPLSDERAWILSDNISGTNRSNERSEWSRWGATGIIRNILYYSCVIVSSFILGTDLFRDWPFLGCSSCVSIVTAANFRLFLIVAIFLRGKCYAVMKTELVLIC